MRLLLPALGVWAAEGCKELGGEGLSVLELGLMWERALTGCGDTTCGLTLLSCQLPNDLGVIRRRGELPCSLTLASSCARPLELACQSPLYPILWPS